MKNLSSPTRTWTTSADCGAQGAALGCHKWIVGLNAGLATASVAINKKAAAGGISGIAILLAGIGIALVIVYSGRITSARNDALKTYR
jgi:hypothetical protein